MTTELMTPPAPGTGGRLEMDPSQAAALAAMQRGNNVFLTGNAGTGKSTVVTTFLGQAFRRVDVTATTGVAALNLRDQFSARSGITLPVSTVYRWAGIGLGPRPGESNDRCFERLAGEGMMSRASAWRRVRSAECLVIDEISMLPGRVFEFLEFTCRRLRDIDRPWGGLQVIAVGDFLQLPPVAKNGVYDWAFLSPAWSATGFRPAVLTKIHRQADPEWVDLLNAVRVGRIEPQHSRILTGRVARFPKSTLLRLFTHNVQVDKWNASRLDAIDAPDYVFEMQERGDPFQVDFLKKNLLTPATLRLKIGARVMVTVNLKDDAGDLHAVNGTMGTVTSVSKEFRTVSMVDDTGRLLTIEEFTWSDDPMNERAAVTQFPLRLAWASTIHKCVSPFTRLQMADHSIRRIAEIKVGDTLQGGIPVLGAARADRLAFRITTKLGYELTASAEHRWATNKGWLQTQELIRAKASIEIAKGDYTADTPINEYAWWLGAMAGDGSYSDSKGGTFFFSTTRKELGDRWKRITIDLGFKKASWRRSMRGLHATSVGLRDKMMEHGLDYVTAREKSVPAWVWENGPSAWRGFIQGLFDTDGCVGHSHVTLTTVSEDMSRDIQELLLLCGIASKRGRFPGVNCPYYQVRVNAQFVRRFEEIIGFTDSAKAHKLSMLHPNRIIQRFDGFDPVVSVEATGREISMCDIEVPPPHRVAFGPFVGHNSQGLSLDAALIDARATREPGQTYVALSRVRSLAGLWLKDTFSGVWVSPDAIKFTQSLK